MDSFLGVHNLSHVGWDFVKTLVTAKKPWQQRESTHSGATDCKQYECRRGLSQSPYAFQLRLVIGRQGAMRLFWCMRR